MGTLVTLNLPDDSPALSLPWIITIGPLAEDDEWEPVVCGPYERAHALALAEAVVADEELMAVVEPVQPHVTVDQIRGEIAASRLAWDEERALDELPDDEPIESYDGSDETADTQEPGPAPTVDEVRAGFARIATLLTRS
ncbi:MAG TPA: hypothetical protein VK453_19605 [Micromonosporaceae bacterium]|nr:hypothetical protein [Micromonosporaceae bacterium]